MSDRTPFFCNLPSVAVSIIALTVVTPQAVLAQDASPTGSFVLNGHKASDEGRPRWREYAGMLHHRVVETFASTSEVRPLVAGGIVMALWVDALGRIERVEVRSSEGDMEAVTTLVRKLFIGVEIGGPPPEDLPMPIVVSLRPRQPN